MSIPKAGPLCAPSRTAASASVVEFADSCPTICLRVSMPFPMLSTPSHRVFSRSPWPWVLLLLLLQVGSAWGHQLSRQPRNGDRLTGRVLSDSTNQAVLATAFAERAPIDPSCIERRETLPPPPPTTAGSTNLPP